MTTYTWFGGSGSFDTADNWSPTGTPSAGDTAFITDGTVMVNHLDIKQVTLDLGTFQASQQPVLQLRDATVGNINLTSGQAPPDGFGYQSIDISHHAIFTGTVTNSFDLGDTLTINLAAHSTLVNHGTIDVFAGPGNSVGLDIEGQNHTRVVNDGVIDANYGQATIDPAVLGIGTIALVAASELEIDSRLELGGLVGSRQTVAFVGQAPAPAVMSLQLDHPKAFHGTIAGFTGSDTIELANTTVTADDFKHGVLTLRDGCDVVARLHFSGSYSTDQFSVTQSGGNAFISFNGSADPAGTVAHHLVAS